LALAHGALELSAAAMVGAIMWWLEDGVKYSAAQVAAWLRFFAVKGFLGVISFDAKPDPTA
jgi:hypothetical protein